MQEVTPAIRARERLDDARNRIGEARIAIDTVVEAPRRLLPSLYAMLFAVADLLGAVREGLQRADMAEMGLAHVFSATNAHNDAAQRGRWRRRASAEDLRTCLTELISASAIVGALLKDLQPHASEQTRDDVNLAPFMLAVASDALAVRRPGMSTDDIVESVSLNLRLLIDTSDGLRRGLEAALIRWDEPDEPCAPAC